MNLKGKHTVSHETIYRFIWKNKAQGGDLYQHLRHKAKRYNKRKGKKAGRGVIPGRIDIEHRPQIVEEKSRFGANHQGASVSVVDRATKLTWVRLVKRGTAQLVSRAICSCVGKLGKSLHTMTSDNGIRSCRP